jgi:hypothetical protein
LVLRLPSFGQDRDKEEQVGTQAASIGQDKDEEEPVGTKAASYWSGQR